MAYADEKFPARGCSSKASEEARDRSEPEYFRVPEHQRCERLRHALRLWVQRCSLLVTT